MNRNRNLDNIDLNRPLVPNGWDEMDLIQRRKSQFYGDYDSSPLVDLVTVQDDLISRKKTLAAKGSFQAICDKMENKK